MTVIGNDIHDDPSVPGASGNLDGSPVARELYKAMTAAEKIKATWFASNLAGITGRTAFWKTVEPDRYDDLVLVEHVYTREKGAIERGMLLKPWFHHHSETRQSFNDLRHLLKLAARDARLLPGEEPADTDLLETWPVRNEPLHGCSDQLLGQGKQAGTAGSLHYNVLWAIGSGDPYFHSQEGLPPSLIDHLASELGRNGSIESYAIQVFFKKRKKKFKALSRAIEAVESRFIHDPHADHPSVAVQNDVLYDKQCGFDFTFGLQLVIVCQDKQQLRSACQDAASVLKVHRFKIKHGRNVSYRNRKKKLAKFQKRQMITVPEPRKLRKLFVFRQGHDLIIPPSRLRNLLSERVERNFTVPLNGDSNNPDGEPGGV